MASTAAAFALRALRPISACYVFLVPDDYATGFEAEMVRETFPQAAVYEPKSYVRFALGGQLDGAPPRVDLVQYYRRRPAARRASCTRRLKGRTATYKFSRRAYRKLFDRAFAVDERNAEQLADWGTPRERIEVRRKPGHRRRALRGSAAGRSDGAPPTAS